MQTEASDGEDVLVVSPALAAMSAVALVAPSTAQLVLTQLTSPVFVALGTADVPPAVTRPVTEGYVVAVEGMTGGAEVVSESAKGFGEAVRPLGPVLNPVVKPAGATAIGAGVAAIEAGDGLARLGGHHNSFSPWLATTIGSAGRGFGF